MFYYDFSLIDVTVIHQAVRRPLRRPIVYRLPVFESASEWRAKLRTKTNLSPSSILKYCTFQCGNIPMVVAYLCLCNALLLSVLLDKMRFEIVTGAGYLHLYIQSTLVISTAIISNNRLSRRGNLVLVLTQKSKIRLQNIVEERRSCSWGAISPLFPQYFQYIFPIKGVKLQSLVEFGCSNCFFPQYYKSDMSKYGYLEVF